MSEGSSQDSRARKPRQDASAPQETPKRPKKGPGESRADHDPFKSAEICRLIGVSIDGGLEIDERVEDAAFNTSEH